MKTMALCAALLFCAAPALAQQGYQDLPTSAGVGRWEAGHKAQSYKISVDGESIFVNGVLQKTKFDPSMDIAIKNGEAAVLVPKGQGLTLRPRAAEPRAVPAAPAATPPPADK
ncbi:MAG: hypothetical protein HY916_07410 [Desulfovibrio sp.]|nr:hypothetical protein [Desulfovibrio sp.]